MKEFLKPDFRKILLFLLFIFAMVIIFQSRIVGGCCLTETTYFWSITHREVDCSYPLASPECKPESSFKIIYQFFVLNVIFWYTVSCLVVWIYDKRKRVVKK